MKRRIMSLITALVMLLGAALAPFPAAKADLMGAIYVFNDAYEGEDLQVGWNYYKGEFDHYEYSLNDLTLDEDTAEIFRVNVGKTDIVVLPGDLIINRHHYRFWVGACDADGNVLGQNKVEFYGVSRQADEELVISISDAYAGQEVDVSWNEIDGAHHYEYTLLNTATGEYLEQRKETKKRAFTIDGEDVHGAQEYKLWVGAVNDNDDVFCDNIQYFTPLACTHGNIGPANRQSSWVQIDGDYHRVTMSYDEMCFSCGEIVNRGLSQTFDEPHVLDSNGDCTLCDLRFSCAHTEKRYEVLSDAYSNESADEHVHDVQYSEYCANPLCGKLLRLQADEKREYVHEAHTFENDKCVKCGRIRAEELQLTVARGQSEALPGDTISATATPAGGSGKYTIAWEVYCGSTLVREQTPFDNQLNMSFVPQSEGEYYFRAWLYDGEEQIWADSAIITVKTDGMCQHANVQEMLGGSDCRSISDSAHELTITWVTTCQDCGQQRSQRQETQTLAHTFVNGVCSDCGVPDGSGPCTHSSMISTEIGKSMYSITTLQHVVETYYRDSCADCGITITESRVVPVEEGHQIQNGVCACGYIEPGKECDHVNIVEVPVDTSYAQFDHSSHQVTRVCSITCADCQEVLSTNVTTTTQEPHTLDANAYCSLCGYTGQCAHAKTNDVWQYASYAPLPDGQHHRKTDVYSRYCADPACGQLLLAADPSLSQTTDEAHTFDGDECTLCHYVRAAAFGATLVLDQTSASEGDTVGVQLKPVGGSGSYTVYWEAYCDGARMDASSTAQTHYTCTAAAQGSWVFRAIARDSVTGESVTVNSAVFTVSGCDHTPTVTPTGRARVERNWNDDANTHKTFTPSRIACDCGLIDQTQEVEQTVAHDYTYYTGVQALHEAQGHALFGRCECGVVQLTGGYQATLDGCEECAAGQKMSRTAPAPADNETTNSGNKEAVNQVIDGINNLINHLDPSVETEDFQLTEDLTEQEMDQLIKALEDLIYDVRGQTYIGKATRPGTDLYNEYHRVLDKDYDMLLDVVTQSLSGMYNEGWGDVFSPAGYEALYDFLVPPHELAPNASQQREERKEMIRATLVDMLNSYDGVKADSTSIWGSVAESLAGAAGMTDEPVTTETIGVLKDGAMEVFHKLNTAGASDSIAWSNNEDVINAMDEGIGYGIEVFAWILEGGAIYAQTEAEKAALAALAARYGNQIYMLDKIEAGTKDQAVKEVCRELRKEIQAAVVKDYSSAEARGTQEYHKLVEQIQLTIVMEVAEKATDFMIALGTEAGMTGTAMSAAMLAKTAFSVSAQVEAGGVLGGLFTHFTGVTIDARHEVLQRSMIVNSIRNDMSTAYASGADSDTLYYLSLLFMNSLVEAYEAMEKMFHGTQASLWIIVTDPEQANAAKSTEAYCKEQRLKIVESLATMVSEYRLFTAP